MSLKFSSSSETKSVHLKLVTVYNLSSKSPVLSVNVIFDMSLIRASFAIYFRQT